MDLEISITNACANYEKAVLSAERAGSIAGQQAVVIDLDQPGQSGSPRAVAVPPYLLHGRVVSLGNPARGEFLARLRRQVEEQAR